MQQDLTSRSHNVSRSADAHQNNLAKWWTLGTRDRGGVHRHFLDRSQKVDRFIVEHQEAK